jgi:glycosyltransferase involved in cell wall biosynthesis
MKKRILYFTLGSELVASSRTRVFQFLPHLARAGFHTKVIMSSPGWDYWVIANFSESTAFQRVVKKFSLKFVRLLCKIYHATSILRLIIAHRKYELLFVQKTTLPSVVVSLLRRGYSGKIFYDFDDAIYVVPEVDRFLREFLPMTSAVFLENTETAEYAERHQAKPHLIIGPIDCERYRPAKKRSDILADAKITVGWIGSESTTKYLKELVEVFKSLKSGGLPFELLMIGSDPSFQPDGFACRRINWNLHTEVSSLSTFDLGIMPLVDDEWSRGKGGYKILQYMAMGLPTIATPVGINAELVSDGITGFLARDLDEWRERLKQLILDPSLRKKMGLAARDSAVKNYSFQKYLPEIIDVFESH